MAFCISWTLAPLLFVLPLTCREAFSQTRGPMQEVLSLKILNIFCTFFPARHVNFNLDTLPDHINNIPIIHPLHHPLPAYAMGTILVCHLALTLLFWNSVVRTAEGAAPSGISNLPPQSVVSAGELSFFPTADSPFTLRVAVC